MAQNGRSRRNGARRNERSAGYPVRLWQERDRAVQLELARPTGMSALLSGSAVGTEAVSLCSARSEHRACGPWLFESSRLYKMQIFKELQGRDDKSASLDVVVLILIMNTVSLGSVQEVFLTGIGGA